MPLDAYTLILYLACIGINLPKRVGKLECLKCKGEGEIPMNRKGVW